MSIPGISISDLSVAQPVSPLQALTEKSIEANRNNRRRDFEPYALTEQEVLQAIKDDFQFWAEMAVLDGANLPYLMHWSYLDRLGALRQNGIIKSFSIKQVGGYKAYPDKAKGRGHKVFFFTEGGFDQKHALYAHKFEWSMGNLIHAWARTEVAKKHLLIQVQPHPLARETYLYIMFNTDGSLDRVIQK